MSPSRTATIIFDLDGTLIDSVPDLLASANRVMAARRLPGFTREEVVPMIGDGAAALVRRLLAARDQPSAEADTRTFLDDYEAHAADATRPYPGIVAMLQALETEGWLMAVCTNKPEAPARAILDTLGLSRFFVSIVGGDTHAARKPDPAHLLHTVEAAGGTRERAIMVGDHHNDIAAATAAGLPSIFVTWGYGHDPGASATATHPDQIPACARLLLDARQDKTER